MSNLDERLKAALKRLDAFSQSGTSTLPCEDPLAATLSELVSALTELKHVESELFQRNQELIACQQAATRYRAYLEQNQSLSAIAQQIRQSLDPQETLTIAASGLQQILQANRAIVYRISDGGFDGKIIQVAAQATQHEWKLTWADLPRDIAAVLESLACQPQNLLAIADTEQADLLSSLADLWQKQQVKAVAIAPILQDNQLIGLLCVHHCESPRQWQRHELDLLNQLAVEIAIALNQSELYQNVQRLNADLEQQVQQRTAEVIKALEFESMLKRITDKVRDSLDESQILQAAVQELTLVLGLGGCNAALYDLAQGTSTIRYEYTSSIPTSFGRVAQMDDFPEIYRQLQQGHYFQFCSLYPNPARGLVAMLACPIFVDPNSSQGINQAVLGDLWLIHHKDYIFTEFEIRLVQQVANQCAIAIRQARFYQAAQVQVQELEKLNRLKDEFLSTVSHELRTPIANLKMAIRMLKISETREKREEYLEILEKESAREAELINDLLDLQRLEATSFPISLEPISLHTWLQALVEPFQSRVINQQQTLTLDVSPDLPVVVSDATILRRILAELLNNACKYTALGGKIQIRTYRVDQSGDFNGTPITVFEMCNEARIPEEELPKIFEKFYRCPNADPWSYGGTGLGLALVQKLVEQLQGKIQAQSADGWTTFTVKLPVL